MMMTDPAFAIKNEVQRLVEVQIDTPGKQSSLTLSELDEYHLRSENRSSVSGTGCDYAKALRRPSSEIVLKHTD
jgi:hypothetical protein